MLTSLIANFYDNVFFEKADGNVARFLREIHDLCARRAGRMKVLGRIALASRSNGCISQRILGFPKINDDK
jgi:hypothetical protein